MAGPAPKTLKRPLVASVPETDALRYPARNLVSPTPLPVVPLPIAGLESVLDSIAVVPESIEEGH